MRFLRPLTPPDWFDTLSRAASLGLLLCWIEPARAQKTEDVSSLGDLKGLSLEQLAQVEVTTVSRSPEKLEDAASAVQVISSDEIRRSGATTIPEALRLATNLEVDEKNSHDWGISARGFNTDLANKLLVMMDGRTLYTPLFSGVRWDVQNYLLEDIDRIEVVSGPGATLWGANAVNGVINIISKPANDTQGLYTEVSAGTEDRSGYGVRFGGKAGQSLYYRIYDTYMDFGPDEENSGQSAHDAWSMHQSGFRIDDDLNSTVHVTLQGDSYQGHEGFVGGGISDVSGANLLGRWTQTFSERSNYSLQVYYDTAAFHQPTLASTFAPFGYAQDRLNTFDVDFQDQMGLNAMTTLIWGLGYRGTKDTFLPSPGLALNPSQLRQDLYSGFAQLSFNLRPDTILTVGSKLEHNAYTGAELQPSARLQWQATKTQLLWTSISRAVRTPSRIDRDISEPSNPPTILEGGEDFASETLIAYEAGYRANVNERMLLSAAFFYNQYDHIRSLTTTPVTVIPLVFANDLAGHTYGAELTSTYQVSSKWRLTAGYDWLQENIHVRPGGVDLNHALNETADPANQISLRSAVDLPAHFELDGQLRWVDSFTINNNGTAAIVPSYADLDLRIGWRPTRRLEISLVGQNLLHKTHPEYGVPGPAQVDATRGVYLKAAFHY